MNAADHRFALEYLETLRRNGGAAGKGAGLIFWQPRQWQAMVRSGGALMRMRT